MPTPHSLLQPRLRFPDGSAGAFGPGKAELLRRIAATGSIRAAAKGMEMSYSRAWTLAREMNGLFREPLVAATRGGGTGGGAGLTELGQEVLRLYTAMEAACRKATQPEWKALRKLLA
jgi:molybdate transport system regulatory protein